MRFDRRFTRIRDMLNCESIPRFANGGLALCHWHQREITWPKYNGFVGYLAFMVDRMAREQIGPRFKADALTQVCLRLVPIRGPVRLTTRL